FAFPSAAAVSKASLRRPARTTENPSCKSASAECLPTPLPAPVTIATFSDEAMSWSPRSEEHTSELQSRGQLVCRLLLEKKKVSSTLTAEGLVDAIQAYLPLDRI